MRTAATKTAATATMLTPGIAWRVAGDGEDDDEGGDEEGTRRAATTTPTTPTTPTKKT